MKPRILSVSFLAVEWHGGSPRTTGSPARESGEKCALSPKGKALMPRLWSRGTGFTRDPRGTRYEVIGDATDGRRGGVVCRFLRSGVLLIITAYAEEE